MSAAFVDDSVDASGGGIVVAVAAVAAVVVVEVVVASDSGGGGKREVAAPFSPSRILGTVPSLPPPLLPGGDMEKCGYSCSG